MLACVGFIFTQYVHLPGDAYQEADPIKAISAVGLGTYIYLFIPSFIHLILFINICTTGPNLQILFGKFD